MIDRRPLAIVTVTLRYSRPYPGAIPAIELAQTGTAGVHRAFVRSRFLQARLPRTARIARSRGGNGRCR